MNTPLFPPSPTEQPSSGHVHNEQPNLGDLTTNQLLMLLAFDACWLNTGRPPSRKELKHLDFKSNNINATVTVLINKGYLSQTWVNGKVIKGTLKSTNKARAYIALLNLSKNTI